LYRSSGREEGGGIIFSKEGGGSLPCSEMRKKGGKKIRTPPRNAAKVHEKGEQRAKRGGKKKGSNIHARRLEKEEKHSSTSCRDKQEGGKIVGQKFELSAVEKDDRGESAPPESERKPKALPLIPSLYLVRRQRMTWKGEGEGVRENVVLSFYDGKKKKKRRGFR